MKNKIIISLIAGSLAIVSCVTQRQIEYMQDKNKNVREFKEPEPGEYQLKPNDELYIQVSSLDEAAAGIFSNSKDNTFVTGSIQPFGAYLLSYSVDKQGFLHIPVIGEIEVAGKTLSGLTKILTDSLAHILNQPLISVKLVNRNISVLGEVKNPGHYTVAQEKISIYDAIGLAGDITIYGNRKHVILIRNENGLNKRINVDLTRSDILANEYYNLRPNDIVYVKPTRRRFWAMDQFPYSIILSTITTALLIYTVVKP